MQHLRTSLVRLDDLSEVKRVLAFSKRYWPEQPKKDTALEELQTCEAIYTVFDRRALVGMVAVGTQFGPTRPDGRMWISHLVVSPDYRNNRLGMMLYGLAISYVHRRELPASTFVTNPAMVPWLTKNGWSRGITVTCNDECKLFLLNYGK